MSSRQNLWSEMQTAEKEQEQASLAVLDAANDWASNSDEENAKALRDAVRAWKQASEDFLRAQQRFEEGVWPPSLGSNT